MFRAAPPLRLSRSNACRQCSRRLTNDAKVFKENDSVLIRATWPPSSLSENFIQCIKGYGEIHTNRGYIKMGDMIGKGIRDTVKSHKGTEYRLFEPTLSEYVALTKRIVTPIYPDDANVIVSLFDIHATPPTAADDPTAAPFEILEAGTGHGSLTLHLARAIHAYNTPPPTAPPSTPTAEPSSEDTEDPSYESTTTDHTADTEPLAAWKASRRAILHTLDISPRHSRHAKRIVQGFRRGLYAGNVDFHVGDVSDFIRQRFDDAKNKRKTLPTSNSDDSAPKGDERHPFLSHALLDLPNAEDHLGLVTEALRLNGALVVFNPSITQIGDVVKAVAMQKLPLYLEQVVEIKGGDTLRKWDVRVVQPRKSQKSKKNVGEGAAVVDEVEGKEEGDEGVEAGSESVEEGKEEGGEGVEAGSESVEERSELSTSSEVVEAVEQVEQQKVDMEQRDQEQAENLDDPINDKDGWKMLCRPKTGKTIGVGGFVGVWRKMRVRDGSKT